MIQNECPFLLITSAFTVGLGAHEAEWLFKAALNMKDLSAPLYEQDEINAKLTAIFRFLQVLQPLDLPGTPTILNISIQR
jgi:hypothetical protein